MVHLATLNSDNAEMGNWLCHGDVLNDRGRLRRHLLHQRRTYQLGPFQRLAPTQDWRVCQVTLRQKISTSTHKG